MSYKKYLPVLLFVINVIILLITSYPSIGWWDSGAYATHARNLSQPGPGGSILFVIIARILTLIFFFLPTIKSVTLLSILSTAGTSVFFYFTLLTLFNNHETEKNTSLFTAISFLSALCLPFLYSIWLESHVSRVYTLGLLLTGIIIFITAKIWSSEDDIHKLRLFILLVFILGIDFSAHRLNSPFFPVLILLLIFVFRKHVLNYRFWLAAGIIGIVSFSIHLYILLRAQFNPPLEMADAQSFDGLLSWITMRRVSNESNFLNIFNRRAPLWNYQIKFMYLRYFGWNFIGKGIPGAIFTFTPPFGIPLILGFAGFVYSSFKHFKSWILIFCLFLLYSIGLIIYSNVSDGFHTIREIDRLFLPSFFIFLLWIGFGLYWLSKIVVMLFTKRLQIKTARISVIFICLIILPFTIFVSNWQRCDHSGFYFPEDFAYNLLSSCEKNAVLFTNGDNDTFPLWYLQSVKEYRKDITVINLSLLNTGFYIKQITQEPYSLPVATGIKDADHIGPSPWDTARTITIPPPQTYQLEQRRAVDSIKFKITPYSNAGNVFILASQKVFLSFLRENNWKRPVYFSKTVSTRNLMGLQDYLQSTGIVLKLQPVKNTFLAPGELEKNLLTNYRFRNFNNPAVLIDRTSLSLFNNFRYDFAALINYYLAEEKMDKAKDLLDVLKKRLPEWRYAGSENDFINEIEKKLQ